MKIKVVETSIIYNKDEEKLNVIDVEILEGSQFLPNRKYINEDEGITFIILSIGHYNPSIVKLYPCTIEIEDEISLSELKDKIFIEVD